MIRGARAIAIAAGLAAMLGIGGCGGGDTRRDRAMETVRLAARAVLIVEDTSGSEDLGEEARAAIDPARADAAHWVEQAEQSIDVWGNSGSLAFATVAPCLGSSLGRLRERLARHDRPIPRSLRLAEAHAVTATEGRCAARRARRRVADVHVEPPTGSEEATTSE